MSVSALVSVILGLASMVVAFVLEGGELHALFEYTAAIIVFGGTAGAVGLSFPAEDLKRIPKMFKVVFKNRKTDINTLIDYFKEIAVKTRKEGLLSMEDEITRNESIDPFVKKGLQLVVDGVEPQTVKAVLEAEAYMTFERHKSGIAIFEGAGGFAPTMGIIGTVMGLVHVLGNLSNPDTLGPSIAVAFIATLYGVASANLLWLPIANKLKAINKQENQEKELMIEAILSIQEGLNPNTLVEKLMSFVDKNQLKKVIETEEVGE